MIQPESRPDVTKGLTMSLYAQGFQQAASGLTPRPKVYAQDRVTEFLAPHILKHVIGSFFVKELRGCEGSLAKLAL